jgi:hypothetical protein
MNFAPRQRQNGWRDFIDIRYLRRIRHSSEPGDIEHSGPKARGPADGLHR